MHERKATAIELDSSGEGTFRARFSTLNVVDKDKDVTFPGAFKSGQAVRIARWGHNWGDLPVGKGVINADSTKAWVDAKFFLDTQMGADTYRTVKALGELQEWSFGYDVLDATDKAEDLAPWPGAVRGLKALDVFEVSPVMLGAGIGTGTEDIKGIWAPRRAKSVLAIIRRKAAAMDCPPEVAAAMAQLDGLIDQADEIADSMMDLLGIPDPDETPADEADDTAGKGYTFADHAHIVQTESKAVVTRAKALVALRGKEGRALSSSNRARLSALVDSMRSGMVDIEKLLEQTAPADDGKGLTLAQLHLTALRDEAFSISV